MIHFNYVRVKGGCVNPFNCAPEGGGYSNNWESYYKYKDSYKGKHECFLGLLDILNHKIFRIK